VTISYNELKHFFS